MEKEKIAVIISVYQNDTYKNVKLAVESIRNQTIGNRLFVNINGPISSKLSAYLHSIKKDGIIFSLSVSKETEEFASSLNILIEKALKTGAEFIARMDADDISLLDRLRQQVEYLNNNKNVDIVGAYIKEFGYSNGIIEYPTKHDEMKKFFVKRNPIAHVTVVFRKRFFEKSGYYPLNTVRNEDTIMWLNGFKSGCIFGNIPKVLVLVRVNKNFFFRRRGFKKIFSDVKDRFKVIYTLNFRIVNYIYPIIYVFLMILPLNLSKSILSYLRYSKYVNDNETRIVIN